MKYNAPRFLLRRFEVVKQIKRGGAFLEIGPGNLNLSIDLLKYFRKGILVDFNKDVIKTFCDLPLSTKRRLHLLVGDISTVSFKRKFDCIIACEVMEHIENDREFIRKLYSLLNFNGQVIISVPAKKRYWSIHDVIVGHFRRYEKKTVIQLFSEEKFNNINIISYGFPFIIALMFPRIFLAYLQRNSKIGYSMQERTKDSGSSPLKKLLSIIRFLINKYTFYPVCIIASIFNKYDFSDGIIITAYKK